MIKIGNALLGKTPAVAVTVTDFIPAAEIRKAKQKAGVCLLLEIRIDRFRRLEENYIVSKIHSFKKLRLPLIATIRSAQEGGARKLSDSIRLKIFRRVLPLVNALDIELASTRLRKNLVPLARRLKKKTILSYHHFASTPSERAMIHLIQRAKRAGADIVKMAVTPKSKSDLARLLLVANQYRDKNLIMIAMGRLGTPSRVLAPLLGSLLTYTFAGKKPQAPGQLSLRRATEHFRLYRVWKRRGQTWT